MSNRGRRSSTTSRDLSLLLERGLRTKMTLALDRAKARELADLSLLLALEESPPQVAVQAASLAQLLGGPFPASFDSPLTNDTTCWGQPLRTGTGS
jgi:hypothetical protein